MTALLIPLFVAIIVAGIINKDIYLITGGGLMLLSCCVIFAAMGISFAINNELNDEE